MFWICVFACVTLVAEAAPQVSPLPSEAVTLRCLDGSIEADVQTNRDFQGVIYTEGSYGDEGCRATPDGHSAFKLKFTLNSCKTKDNGKGVYTNVLIVQNEDRLVTLEDSAFEIKCDYTLKKTITLHAQRPIQVEEEPKTPAAESVASIGKTDIFMSTERTNSNVILVTNGSSVARHG